MVSKELHPKSQVMIPLSNDEVCTINRIRQYMVDNVPNRLKVDQLVAMSGMNRSKLTRGFKFLYQITIYQYWLEVSMAYAERKMQEGAMAKEIGLSLGYSKASSFARAFALVHGTTPTAIKRQQ